MLCDSEDERGSSSRSRLLALGKLRRSLSVMGERGSEREGDGEGEGKGGDAPMSESESESESASPSLSLSLCEECTVRARG